MKKSFSILCGSMGNETSLYVSCIMKKNHFQYPLRIDGE